MNNVHHNSPELRLFIYYRNLQKKAEDPHIQEAETSKWFTS